MQEEIEQAKKEVRMKKKEPQSVQEEIELVEEEKKLAAEKKTETDQHDQLPHLSSVIEEIEPSQETLSGSTSVGYTRKAEGIIEPDKLVNLLQRELFSAFEKFISQLKEFVLQRSSRPRNNSLLHDYHTT